VISPDSVSLIIMHVACPTSGISARRNVNLLTSVRCGLSYSWKMVRAKGGLCVANRASPHPARTFSLAAKLVSKQTPDIIKTETYFPQRVRHAFVARRMVAHFNCAI
jgi:hypothetical protein